MNFDCFLLLMFIAYIVLYVCFKECEKETCLSILKLILILAGAILLVVNVVNGANISVVKVMFIYSLCKYCSDGYDEIKNLCKN